MSNYIYRHYIYKVLCTIVSSLAADLSDASPGLDMSDNSRQDGWQPPSFSTSDSYMAGHIDTASRRIASLRNSWYLAVTQGVSSAALDPHF